MSSSSEILKSLAELELSLKDLNDFRTKADEVITKGSDINKKYESFSDDFGVFLKKLSLAVEKERDGVIKLSENITSDFKNKIEGEIRIFDAFITKTMRNLEDSHQEDIKKLSSCYGNYVSVLTQVSSIVEQIQIVSTQIEETSRFIKIDINKELEKNNIIQEERLQAISSQIEDMSKSIKMDIIKQSKKNNVVQWILVLLLAANICLTVYFNLDTLKY